LTLGDAWERHARNWIAWSRTPGHDSYWRFHRDAFLELLPAPQGTALDLGCGEGRLTRDLAERGYEIAGVDLSPTLLAAARAAAPELEFFEADAAALPFGAETFDLVVAFMSLQDIDEMERTLSEAGRVLRLGGVFCTAVVHPLNSAGTFASREPDSPFVIADSYFERRRYVDHIERDDLTMTFVSDHRSFADYVNPLLDAGLVLDRVREVSMSRDQMTQRASERWLRIPLFLHLRAHRPMAP
jgi:SAM-dependent methyltransferase